MDSLWSRSEAYNDSSLLSIQGLAEAGLSAGKSRPGIRLLIGQGSERSYPVSPKELYVEWVEKKEAQVFED